MLPVSEPASPSLGLYGLRRLVSNMSKSRAKPKPTIKMIDERINIMTNRIDQFLNILIAKLIEHDGMMDTEDCPSCQGTIRTPMFDGIVKVDDCPYCGCPLREGEQTTLPMGEEEE